MATFEVLTAFGVDSDWLFPALRGGNFTVVTHTSSTFTIKYASDGNPGAGLLVTFVSDANNFAYDGNDLPTGGTFNEIGLSTSSQIPIPLASWTGLASTALSSFNDQGLANSLLSGADILTGNSGNDILHGHGGQDISIGNGGNDSFVLSGDANGSLIDGAADNGSGGGGEIDTIVVSGGFSLGADDLTNIDAITFASQSSGASLRISGPSATFPGGISSTLVVTGNDQYNRLGLDPSGGSVNLDYSGFTFINWTDGVDEVSIGDTNSSDAIIGTMVSDSITSSGGADTFVGKGGNDVFHLALGIEPVALHGSNADGTGGANEIDIIDIGAGNHDLRAVTMSNIDGFTLGQGDASLDFDPANGAITNAVRVATLDATQFGTSIAKNIRVIGDDPNVPTTFGFEVTNASKFDASHWIKMNVSGASVLHVTGTGGNNTMTGWSAIDVFLLGDGNDTAVGSLGADHYFGGAGRDTVNYAGSAAGVSVNLSFSGTQSGGQAAGDVLKEFENVTGSNHNDKLTGNSLANLLKGLSGSDTLIGGSGKDTLVGGFGKDVQTGGANRDLFDFNSIKDSVRGNKRDMILDFTRGQDDIDLRGIDAKKGVSGNQKFKFIGGNDFHDTKGELRYEDKGAKVIVQGDTNGDGKADFEILVKVGALSAGDFLL